MVRLESAQQGWEMPEDGGVGNAAGEEGWEGGVEGGRDYKPLRH